MNQTMQKMLRMPGIAFLVALAWSGLAGAQISAWTEVPTTQQFLPGVTLLLTDGTVLIQQINSSNWWKLTPDKFANYTTGTMAPVASFPMAYSPWGFASAVLPDGRVIVEGGEYNFGMKKWSTLGAIYDPVANFWTQVNPPASSKGTPWPKIGDVQSVVLPDGTFMMANKCPEPCTGGTVVPKGALLNETALTWTVLYPTKGYKGKLDQNTEEGWTLLPNGNVLTVDTYTDLPADQNGTESQTYNPTTGVWTKAGSTIVQLWDSRLLCTPGKLGEEIGPAVLRPDGTVFATGSNGCPGAAGHTAIYDTKTGIWTPGPDIPGVNDAADVPAALLPDGNVLLSTGPGVNKGPITFYEFALSGAGWVSIPQPTGLNSSLIESGRMLVLPTGQILYTQGGAVKGVPELWFYTSGGTYQASWQPTIAPGGYPTTVNIGGTYTVTGTQFNGLSQGAAYGDEAQSATNYPLVRITNNITNHQFFARTHTFSTMGVATGAENVSTEFDVLAGTETGASTMVVIANGIPSATVAITVNP